MQPFLALLVRSRLLSAGRVQQLWQQWQAHGGPTGDDPAPFVRWLVAEQQLTSFQAALLLKGKADSFILGEYTLLDRIGTGRMAGIFLARHRLGHVVAIKVLPPSRVKDTEAFGRFRREARLAMRLKHPNIVRTFHSGQQGELLYYLVMEHLEGETLVDVLKGRGRLPVADSLSLLEQALAGLQHIHEQGMIHRDLKPGNIMLVPLNDFGPLTDTAEVKVKLLDIGLGRELFDEDGGGVEGGQLTMGEDLLGSPAYMSPEQARNAHSADIRSDIYSLGCVFFECLTGRAPFPDKTPARLVLRHATEPPPRLASLLPQAPPGLQVVLDRMLAKDPQQRYQTPADAIDALSTAMEDAGPALVHTIIDQFPQDYLTWLESTQKDEEEPSPIQRTVITRETVAEPVRESRSPRRSTVQGPDIGAPAEEEAEASEEGVSAAAWFGIVGGVVAVAAIGGVLLGLVLLRYL